MFPKPCPGILCALCVLGVSASVAAARQLLPPAKDGDVRVVYWDLFDRTEVFVALDPQVTDAGGTPPGLRLTISYVFAGHRPAARATDATQLDVRAYAGRVWAPQPELWFLTDGEHLDVADLQPAWGGTDSGWDSVSAKLTLHDVSRIANAREVTGNFLRLRFKLTPAQQTALAAFIHRVTSDDPAAAK